MSRHAAIVACLVVLTLAAYWGVGTHDFINYDDQEYVTENPAVQSGLSRDGVRWAFISFHAANWHPLTWLSHMLDVELFGMNPGGHHFSNLLLHLINTVLLFTVLHRMTGAPWRSALVAGLFALHPLHVESVAWVSERKDVLSTCFGLLTLLAYSRYVRRPGPAAGSYALVILFFVLSLLAKPMLVTLPFLMLLLDYWPLNRLSAVDGRTPSSVSKIPLFFRLVLEKLPLMALSVGSSLITLAAQKEAMTPIDIVSFQTRLLNALLSYTVYINKMVWPESLSVFYPLQLNIPLWLAAFSTAVFITISGLALWCVRSRPYLFTGWFWYVGMLVPVIGLVQVGGQALADRYSYLPLTGLFVLVVWTLSESKISLRYGTRLLWPTAGAVLLLFAFLTFRQNDLWRNDLSLFSHAAKINNNNSMAHSLLGSHFIKTGQIEEALKNLRVAIRIKPDDTKTQYNMGVALAHAKRFAEAEAHFVAAIKGDPRFGKAYYNLGFIQSARGDHQSAVDNFFHALQYLPASDEALSSLAFSLSEAGRTEEAISYYFNFLQRHPDQPDIYNNIGVAYARMGLMDDAEPYFKKAIALDPQNEDAWRNLKQLPARTSNKSAPK